MLNTQQPDSYRSRIDWGTENLDVSLWSAPDPDEAAKVLTSFAETTFGDLPHPTKWLSEGLEDFAWETAHGATQFKHVIPNAMETVVLTFGIDGLSRTASHQLVRTRVGAVFGQFSQRANNLSGFNVRLPITIKGHPATARYLDSLEHLQRYYASLVASGVPFQDARFVVPEATETSIAASYNLLSLISTIKRRACNRMQWEINYIARRMSDETVKALPWVGRALRPGCERGRCQTMDPMFEESCMYYRDDTVHVDFAEDGAALLEEHGEERNYRRDMNPAFTQFVVADQLRLTAEGRDPNIVVSMVDGRTILAERKNGVWTRV